MLGKRELAAPDVMLFDVPNERPAIENADCSRASWIVAEHEKATATRATIRGERIGPCVDQADSSPVTQVQRHRLCRRITGESDIPPDPVRDCSSKTVDLIIRIRTPLVVIVNDIPRARAPP